MSVDDALVRLLEMRAWTLDAEMVALLAKKAEDRREFIVVFESHGLFYHREILEIRGVVRENSQKRLPFYLKNPAEIHGLRRKCARASRNKRDFTEVLPFLDCVKTCVRTRSRRRSQEQRNAPFHQVIQSVVVDVILPKDKLPRREQTLLHEQRNPSTFLEFV